MEKMKPKTPKAMPATARTAQMMRLMKRPLLLDFVAELGFVID